METDLGFTTSYNVTPEELFDLFGKFGPIRYALQSGHASM